MNKIQPQDLISIIVLNYNGEKYLSRCLRSLSELNYKNIEVIVVDNGSTDKSKDIIKSYSQFKSIIIKSGLGFSGGNNIGIKEANGKYILLINNDTWVENEFLNSLVKFYNTSNFEVIAPREADYDGNVQERYITTIDYFGHNVFIRDKKKSHQHSFYLTGACLLFSKDLYTMSKGLDEDFFLYYEDVDWFWRLQLLDISFSYADTVFINHKGAGSTGGSLDKKIKYSVFLWRNQNTLQMLLKNYAGYSLILVIPIYLAINIFEMIFFLLLLKPSISYTYILGWYYNLKVLNKTLKKRRWIQKNRKISDKVITKRMYKGFGKIYHLQEFFSNK